jgi:hypothetical protein
MLTCGSAGRAWRGGPHDGVGFVVKELSPYETELDWSRLTEADESTSLVDFQTEDAIAAVVRGREGDLVRDVVAFGLEYGARARADHALFVDAFRAGRIESVAPRQA